MKNPSYLIIGNGRMARHFKRYLRLKKIPFASWRRQNLKTLEKAAAKADIVVLLISDSVISDFINKNPFLKNKKLVHFSACLHLKNILDMHPLAAFAERPLSLKEYKDILFISSNPEKVKKIFPKIKNPVLKINPSMKPLYHALCVLGGNFPLTLWHKTLKDLSGKFRIPKKFIFGYFAGNLMNFINNPPRSLTGPLARNDKKTINSNLKALGRSPYADIYRSFLKAAQTKRRRNANKRFLRL